MTSMVHVQKCEKAWGIKVDLAIFSIFRYQLVALNLIIEGNFFILTERHGWKIKLPNV